MSEAEPIRQEDLQFQATQAMKTASRSVFDGFRESDRYNIGRNWNREEIIAASIIASSIIRLIAEGKIEKFPTPPAESK